ncbi:hypothetical protein PoB_003930000 [Plakobranchus ocellatus]|uniref:Uncharacterized protein n=1 Tax=Plakobranchus ocellatus TaxID=259542 RepID=A0AAV4B134_9GAST|nr:hypothetical protein PoB_003930000 [Plakobranchus ocellatus]
MCTQEVQPSTRDTQFGKTSECAHKRSNSTRDRNLARHPNVHTQGPTLNMEYESRQNYRMCTLEVHLSTRDRQFVKTSEFAHKRSNSQHGIGILARLPNVHTRVKTLSTG